MILDATKPAAFPATRWTLLERVRLGTEEDSQAALEVLCRAYWYPLYAVARKKSLSEEDAQDAVQSFFLQMLRREEFAKIDRSRGKLRSLLLSAFEHHIIEIWRREHALKRGGLIERIPWVDVEAAEERYLKTEADGRGTSLEIFYLREWARSVLERSLEALATDYAQRKQKEKFEAFSQHLGFGDSEQQVAPTMERLNLNYGAFRAALHRFRLQYRSCIEKELAVTLDTDDQKLIRQELRDLLGAFDTP